jgi:hypothetical protein
MPCWPLCRATVSCRRASRAILREMPPDERQRGLDPEERLRGLDPDALRSLDPQAREMSRQLLGKLKKRLVRLRWSSSGDAPGRRSGYGSARSSDHDRAARRWLHCRDSIVLRPLFPLPAGSDFIVVRPRFPRPRFPHPATTLLSVPMARNNDMPIIRTCPSCLSVCPSEAA